MKKRITAAAAAAVLLSSCSTSSIEDLLSPPRLDGEQSEIYAALRDFTNGEITLKYPRSGQYRSAFVVRDLDNESTDEAVVFYEMPNISDGASLRLNFLDKYDNRWVSVYDMAASGSEVESVRFEDLGLGTVTMIVTYLMQSSSDRYTSVMTYSGGTPTELMNVRNIYTDAFDANGSGASELFTITNERVSGNTMAGIYGTRDGKFIQLGFVPLNSGFAGIRDVICGSCDPSGTHAIFVDYAFSDGSFGTDAVIYNNNYFYLSPALDPNITVRNSNTYTPYISCKDIDGDGSIEIPSTVPFPEYTHLPAAEQVNMTVWHTLDRWGTKVSDKCRSFVGTKGDYMFIFPENWGGVTAAVSISESTVVFNRYDPISEIKGEEFLKLYGAAEGSTPKFDTEKCIMLGKSETTGYTYYAELSNSPVSPSEDELRKLFVLQ